MIRLVHLSDLHFGAVDESLVIPLLESVRRLEPQLVVVSGDLTQRARPEEFGAAQRFLARLPPPVLAVPGNHDIPLHPWERLLRPLRRYRTEVSEDLEPFWRHGDIAVLGLNTARSLTGKNGRIDARQRALIESRFSALPSPGIMKVVFTHHPFDLPEGARRGDLVRSAEATMGTLARCAVDLLLAGHMHLSLSGRTASRYRIAGFSAIFVQAGTALSTRGRGEPNSFNRIDMESGRLRICPMHWNPRLQTYRAGREERFERDPHGWNRVDV